MSITINEEKEDLLTCERMQEDKFMSCMSQEHAMDMASEILKGKQLMRGRFPRSQYVYKHGDPETS